MQAGRPQLLQRGRGRRALCIPFASRRPVKNGYRMHSHRLKNGLKPHILREIRRNWVLPSVPPEAEVTGSNPVGRTGNGPGALAPGAFSIGLVRIRPEVRAEAAAWLFAVRLNLAILALAGLRRVENVYLQVDAGILDERAYGRIGFGFYRTQFSGEVWKRNQRIFDPDFVAFFEERMAN